LDIEKIRYDYNVLHPLISSSDLYVKSGKNQSLWVLLELNTVKFSHIYSLPSVGPGADPDVQVVSLQQVTLSHPPNGRLPLLSATPAVTFPDKERHRPSAGTKLYSLVTEAHGCEELSQGCYMEADRSRFEPTTFWIASERSTVTPHRPHTTGAGVSILR